MVDNLTLDPWYGPIANRYGRDFAIEAGYFEEISAWGLSYVDQFGLDFLTAKPGVTKVVQFSGAFWPFHAGHLHALQLALNFLKAHALVVVHVDHEHYRHSKGRYQDDKFDEAFELLSKLNSEFAVDARLLFEDKMQNGCSRNFTRLYGELEEANSTSEVWFLAGGDRAQFGLSFIDRGRCIVAGRDEHPNFRKYRSRQTDRYVFLEGHRGESSSSIRGRE